MIMEVIRTQNGGLEKITLKEDEVLIFRLNRVTDQITKPYIEAAREQLRDILPKHVSALIVGCDVDVFVIAGVDATALKIKGIGK